MNDGFAERFVRPHMFCFSLVYYSGLLLFVLFDKMMDSVFGSVLAKICASH